MEPTPHQVKEAAKKKAKFLWGKDSTKKVKMMPNVPPSRTHGEGSSTGMTLHPRTTKEAFTEAHLHCIAEFKVLEAFKGELLDASAVGFMQGFEDCKARIKYLMLQLDLHCLHLKNSDEEAGPFSLDED